MHIFTQCKRKLPTTTLCHKFHVLLIWTPQQQSYNQHIVVTYPMVLHDTCTLQTSFPCGTQALARIKFATPYTTFQNAVHYYLDTPKKYLHLIWNILFFGAPPKAKSNIHTWRPSLLKSGRVSLIQFVGWNCKTAQSWEVWTHRHTPPNQFSDKALSMEADWTT